MVDIRVTINDNGLAAALRGKAGQINRETQSLIKDLTDIAHKWVQREAPRRTGRLKGAGIEKGTSGDHGWVFASKARVPYMDFVIDGTRAHDIKPKRSQALSWPGASHPVKRVHHPGTRSNPFVDRAAEKINGEVDRRINLFIQWLEEF